MKAILTLVLVVFLGTTAMAKTSQVHGKVDTVSFGIATSITIDFSTQELETLTLENKQEVARLYKFKNSRVKKALLFKTKRDKSQLA